MSVPLLKERETVPLKKATIEKQKKFEKAEMNAKRNFSSSLDHEERY